MQFSLAMAEHSFSRLLIPRAGFVCLLLSAAAQCVTAQLETGARVSATTDSTAGERTISLQQPIVEAPAWHSMVTNLPGDWARSAQLTVQPAGLEAVVGIGLSVA